MRKQLLNMNSMHLILSAMVVSILTFILRITEVGLYPPTEKTYALILDNTHIYNFITSWIAIDPLVLAMILSISLSLIYIIIVYLITKKFFPHEISLVASFLIVFTPIFTYSLLVFNDNILAVIIVLLSLYLIILEHNILKIIGITLSFSIPFISLFHVFTFTLLLWTYTTYNRRVRYMFYITSALLLALAAIQHIGTHIEIRIRENLLSGTLTDLGGMYGFGTFTIILAIIGFSYSWSRKKELWPVYISLFFLLFSWIFTPDAGLLLMIFLSVFSGYALIRFHINRWKLTQIKKVSILLIYCGLLFSFISYTTVLTSEQPNRNTIDNLEMLKPKIKGEVILTDIELKTYIEYFTDNTVINQDKNDRIKNDTNKILYGRNLDKAIALLVDYNISHIIITEEMKNGKIWREDGEGLLFLLQNKDTFKKIFNTTTIEAWKVN
jgi:hypothetical protein